MLPFVLFCKSFRDDVLRAKKLLDSVIAFNEDLIPFYLSVPEKDLALFQEHINFNSLRSSYKGVIELITDESIVLSNPKSNLDAYYSTKGYIGQQVIKAEAWRLLQCDAYLSLDSDSFFTKPFHLHHFLDESGIPFTIMHDGKELLSLSEQLNYPMVKEFFLKDSRLLKHEFGRNGNDYDFGPSPLIWSAQVWQSLENHLIRRQETIWQAFNRIPSEIRWYGESLLQYQAIPLYPILPIFKCYHYDWQAQYYRKHPNLIVDSNHIIGEVIQSYWDDTLRPEFAQKSWASRFWKRIKSNLRK
jgi:hypothetical protein